MRQLKAVHSDRSFPYRVAALTFTEGIIIYAAAVLSERCYTVFKQFNYTKK